MPDDSLDPNLTLRISGDASDAVKATHEAGESSDELKSKTAALGDVADATAESEEALTAKIQAQRAQMMQSVFQAHRLMEGLKDISEGGRLASQGFVDLEETLGRFLPPMAQVGLALASGVGLLIMMAERHRGAGAAARQHAEDEKNSLSDLEQATEAYARSYAEAAKVVLAAQAEVEANDKSQLAAIREKQRLTTEQIKLDEQEATEKARQQYLVANAAATTDKERKRLKEQFDAVVSDIKSQSTVASAQANLEFKKEDIAQGDKTLNDLRSSRADDLQRLNEAQDAAATAKNNLALHGITLDEKGELPKDADKAAKDKIAAAQAELDTALAYATQLRKFREDNGATHEVAEAGFNAYIKGPFKALEDAQNELAKIQQAPGVVKAYGEAQEKYGGSIKGYDEKIASQETSNDELKASIPQLTQALNNATLAQENDRKQREQEAALEAQRAAAQQAFDDRRAEREKQLSDIEAQIDAAQDEATKAALEKKKANVEASGTEDEANTDFKAGRIDQVQRNAQLEKAKNTRSIAATDAQKQVDESASKELRDKIDAQLGQIDAGGDEQLIALARKVEETFRGKTDTASQVLELAQLMGLHVDNFNSYQSQTDREIRNLHGKVDRNSSTSR